MKTQRGAVIILVAISLVVLLGFTALAIDLGYRHVVKNQLQDIADGAALAAARRLGNIYQAMSYSEQQAYDVDASGDRATIVSVAQSVGSENKAGAKSDIVINASDVQIGRWEYDTRTYCDSLVSNPACPSPNPTTLQPDAVKVTARRDTSANGPFDTFFAKIFGINSLSVEAHAVAALTGKGTADPGELQLPVGISEDWFKNTTTPGDDYCGKTIKFSPSTDPLACAGWNTFDDTPANDNKVRDILSGPLDSSPFTDVSNTTFYYTNGDLSANTFENLMTAFENNGHDTSFQYDPNDPNNIPTQADQGAPLYDTDGVTQLRYPPCSGGSGCSGPPRYSHEWPTTVVVYKSSDCTPSGPIQVAGFARVVVYDVGQPSNKTIAARIDCDFVTPQPDRGGGGEFGEKGSIPQLVE